MVGGDASVGSADAALDAGSALTGEVTGSAVGAGSSFANLAAHPAENHPLSSVFEDWAWLAAWTAKWLREQRIRKRGEQRRTQRARRCQTNREEHTKVDESRCDPDPVWRSRVRREARQRRERFREEARLEEAWAREEEIDEVLTSTELGGGQGCLTSDSRQTSRADTDYRQAVGTPLFGMEAPQVDLSREGSPATTGDEPDADSCLTATPVASRRPSGAGTEISAAPSLPSSPGPGLGGAGSVRIGATWVTFAQQLARRQPLKTPLFGSARAAGGKDRMPAAAAANSELGSAEDQRAGMSSHTSSEPGLCSPEVFVGAEYLSPSSAGGDLDANDADAESMRQDPSTPLSGATPLVTSSPATPIQANTRDRCSSDIAATHGASSPPSACDLSACDLSSPRGLEEEASGTSPAISLYGALSTPPTCRPQPRPPERPEGILPLGLPQGVEEPDIRQASSDDLDGIWGVDRVQLDSCVWDEVTGVWHTRTDSADSTVWDEAQRHAVEQILEGSTSSNQLTHLPVPLMQKLLRPRGYELPELRAQTLGKGTYGRVLKVRRVSDGQLLAIKRQFLGDFADDVVPVLRETSILNVLKGACNIVQIEDAFLVRPTKSAAEVWSVLEHFPHNLHKVRHRFRSEEAARRVVFQVLLGLHSLHSADIVHRDLKPDNVLIDLGSSSSSTLRVALCDFNISRSVHGFASERSPGSISTPGPLTRKVTDRVTTSWWRAPEMWGWADTRHMTKRDLKSLDVFALGLIWAELLAVRSVLEYWEGVDPPKFRLLEILQKVDRPTDADLQELGFSDDVSCFIRCVLSGNLEALRPELAGPKWPKNREPREALLQAPYIGIQRWVQDNAWHCDQASPIPALIASMARFSYRERPTVEELLADALFRDLRAEAPPKVWAHREAPHFDDVREALRTEQQRQGVAAKRAKELRELRGGSGRDRAANASNSSEGGLAGAQDLFLRRLAESAAADVEESVRKVCAQVRTVLGETSQRAASQSQPPSGPAESSGPASSDHPRPSWQPPAAAASSERPAPNGQPGASSQLTSDG